jgi:hypothetical protein
MKDILLWQPACEHMTQHCMQALSGLQPALHVRARLRSRSIYVSMPIEAPSKGVDQGVAEHLKVGGWVRYTDTAIGGTLHMGGTGLCLASRCRARRRTSRMWNKIRCTHALHALDTCCPPSWRLAQGAGFAIWTTTPWTIPANLAVAVNGSLTYALVAAQVGWLVSHSSHPGCPAVPGCDQYLEVLHVACRALVAAYLGQPRCLHGNQSAGAPQARQPTSCGN